MPTSLVSTGVQFPDNTIQTTAASASALVLLQTATASASAEIDLTSFSSTYDDYMVIFENVQQSGGSNRLTFRVNVGGTFRTTNSYVWTRHRMNSSNGNYEQNQTSGAAYAELTGDMGSSGAYGAGAAAAGTIWFYGANSSIIKTGLFQCYARDIAIEENVNYRGHGVWTGTSSTGTLSGVRFLMSSGNLNTGVFRLYGIAKS